MGANIALQVVCDGPASADDRRGSWREPGRRGPNHMQKREVTRTIKQAAPRPLAAETLVADFACRRDPWVES